MPHKKSLQIKKTGRNANKAFKLFIRADEAWNDDHLAKAFELFMQAAMLGDVSSQLNVGYFFGRGLHVKMDKSKAMYWYYQAYHQGDASAANNIAIIHGEHKVFGKMIWWLRRALKLGDQETLLAIGKCYETGLGCQRNPNKAERCYRRLLSSTYVSEASRDAAKKRLAGIKKSRSKRVTHSLVSKLDFEKA